MTTIGVIYNIKELNLPSYFISDHYIDEDQQPLTDSSASAKSYTEESSEQSE